VIYQEKDGSFTINCNKGEITMSTRSFGMTGKAYRSVSEAFRDADYANAVEMPDTTEYSHFWALMGVLMALGIGAWLFSRF